MRPSQMLRSGGGGTPLGKYEKYIGDYGSFGTQKQKNIISYGLSPNRQRPLAGTMHAAVFNVWRRFSHQVLYFLPPFAAAYYAVQWTIERNHYLNSKAGRLEFGEGEQ